ncbi:MAG: ankyrin repeat domain-containing protein [Candidatus Cardinium sp.]|nr:ankyrin repeat domain-containing protein [Cardinium endosymbiont of Dermatophagoides farinae]TSJ80535.1 ankyrin repeat domain-containing protein [Cardinium endosymbiont of Dermatophagoides farinae]UWW96508.1 MAG: ankyrin repeat domain-containing protein [Candidatus Cardinium sp.]
MGEQDSQGNTIAHWIVARGRNDMLKVLIEYKVDLNIEGKKGETILHAMITAMDYAITKGDSLLMQYLYYKKDSILNQLLSLPPSRIDFNKEDQFEYTPLALALKLNLYKEIIEKLKEKEEEGLPFKKRKKFKSAHES